MSKGYSLHSSSATDGKEVGRKFRSSTPGYKTFIAAFHYINLRDIRTRSSNFIIPGHFHLRTLKFQLTYKRRRLMRRANPSSREVLPSVCVCLCVCVCVCVCVTDCDQAQQ